MAQEATALLDILNKATNSILGEYSSSGVELPSLSSTERGPFDLPEDASFELLRNLRLVEAAASQLVALLTPPGHTMLNKSLVHVECAALQVVTQNKIADILSAHHEGLSAEELANQTGLDAGKLGRILRLLASKHVFAEVKPGVFANNRLSARLVYKDPVAGYVRYVTDTASLKTSAYLNQALTDPQLAHSTLPQDTAFRLANGVPVFDYAKQNEAYGVSFNEAMKGWGEVTGKGMLAKSYPWETVKAGSTVVDVGGGTGHVLLKVLRAYPHIKAVVQDTPAVVEDGVKFCKEEFPDILESNRVHYAPIDFLTQAPYSDGDIYYLRHIVHNWPDAQARAIVTQIRKSTVPNHSRLIIQELSPQPVARHPSPAPYDQAPEPLLANFGMGKRRTGYMDMRMMELLNARERTVEEFKAMVEPVGFRFLKVYDAGETVLIEFLAVEMRN